MTAESSQAAPRFDDRLLEAFAASLSLSPRSVTAYKKCLAYFFKYLAGKGIARPERGDIAAYQETLAASGKKAATVYSYLAAIRAFFRWTAARGLYRNIAEKVFSAPVDHTPNRKTLIGPELKKLMSCIDRGSLQGLRDYAILAVMLTGGLSAFEVSRANVGDIRASGEGILLDIRGGGQKRHAVKVPPRVMEALTEYLEARGSRGPDAPLFTSLSMRNRDRNEHMSAGSISRIVKEALRRAGYDDARLTAHSLKVSSMKLALQRGERLEDVQRFARHKHIRTTFLYEQTELAP